MVVTGVYIGAGWGMVMCAAVGTGGVVWSLLYERQKTIVGAWVSRALVDLSLMIIGYRLLFMASQ